MPGAKERRRKHCQTPEYKKRDRERRNKPEAKAKRKAYMQRPEVKKRLSEQRKLKRQEKNVGRKSK